MSNGKASKSVVANPGKIKHSGKLKYDNPDRKFYQKKFKKQFVLLTADKIVMFNDSEAVGKKKPENIIKLNRFASVVDIDNHEKKKNTFAVKIYAKNKKGEQSEQILHWFSAEDEQQRKQWISEITQVIDQKKEGQIVLHLKIIKSIQEGDVKTVLKMLHEGVYSKNAYIQYSTYASSEDLGDFDGTEDDEEQEDDDDEPVSSISDKEKKQILDMGYVEGDTLLHIAAKNGAAKVVKSLLERKCDVFVKNCAGDTPLHLVFSDSNYKEFPVEVTNQLAIGSQTDGTMGSPRLRGKTVIGESNRPGREEIVELLLQTDQIPVDTKNNDDFTPLALACKRNDYALASALLNKDANPDICPKGTSPLHYAIAAANQRLLELLLKRGAADPNVADSEGYTPLDRAVQRFKEAGIVGIVSTIFSESNPKVNVNHNDLELLKRYVYLFASNAEIFGKKGVRLLESILESHPDYVLIRYREGDLVEVPLIQAIKKKNTETAEIILKFSTEEVANRPEVREDGCEYYPLHVALMNQLDSITEILLNNGANCHQKSGKEQALPMLHAAQFRMRDDLSELLVEKTMQGMEQEQQIALLNDAPQQGQTVLYFAVQHTSLRFVQSLIDRGADVKVTSERGETILCAACYAGNLDVVKFLVEEKGFDPSGTGKEPYIENGYPPIHCAAKSGHVHVMEYLIEKGVDINSHRHELHMRPIQLACLNGHLEAVKYLLANGCDTTPKIKTKDDAGISCLHLAAGYGFPEIVSILIDHGMDVMERTEITKSSPLDFALRRHQLSVVKLLCDRGSVSDSVTLQLAVQTGSEEVLKWVEAVQTD